MKKCCWTTAVFLIVGLVMTNCTGIYYATASAADNQLILAKSEFIIDLEKNKKRTYVLVKSEKLDFPICVYQISDNQYASSLLKCTHRGCELNVGGGIYTCPCHGSEFSVEGEVLEGPAIHKLTMFKTITDNENIYIQLH